MRTLPTLAIVLGLLLPGGLAAQKKTTAPSKPALTIPKLNAPDALYLRDSILHYWELENGKPTKITDELIDKNGTKARAKRYFYPNGRQALYLQDRSDPKQPFDSATLFDTNLNPIRAAATLDGQGDRCIFRYYPKGNQSKIYEVNVCKTPRLPSA